MTNPRLCSCGRAVVGEYTPDQCRRCWLELNTIAYAARAGLPLPDVDRPIPPLKATSLELVRKERCESLLGRVESLPMCPSGMVARHGCKLSLPAVPGRYCQTCTKYVAEPGEPWA